MELTAFRRHLHAHPEVSGEERWTAAQVAGALRDLGGARVVTGLGGHGGTAAAGLEIAVSYHDDFAACTNDTAAVAVLARACAAQGLVMGDAGLPMHASEDFGRFGTVARSAMFLLGAAESAPVLHAPDYDFADDRIGPGVRVFDTVPRDLLG